MDVLCVTRTKHEESQGVSICEKYAFFGDQHGTQNIILQLFGGTSLIGILEIYDIGFIWHSNV